MSRKICIRAGSVEMDAELNDCAAAGLIRDALPITGRANRWGEEIYFSIPVSATPENPTTDVDVGTLAYWGPGKAFCIFFGRTPASSSDKPVPASEVEIVGKTLGDATEFTGVGDGEEVVITAAE